MRLWPNERGRKVRIVQEINLDTVHAIVETAHCRITYYPPNDPVPFTLWTKNPNDVWVMDSQHRTEAEARAEAAGMGLM